MGEPMWRIEEVARHLGLSLKDTKRIVMRGNFPSPLKLTTRMWRWFPDEVRGWRPSQEEPSGCQLYRHYDKNGRLLYVGISLSYLYRLAKHREQSAWFRDVATIKVRHFPTRAAARAAEKAAIAKWHPMFNRSI